MQRQQKAINETSNSANKVKGKMVILWWKYLDTVYELLTNNPGQIKKSDMNVIGKLVDAYLATNYLGRDIPVKMDYVLYRKLAVKRRHVSKVVKELEELILDKSNIPLRASRVLKGFWASLLV